MQKINAKTYFNGSGVIWVVDTKKELDENDIEFLVSYEASIYHNDMTGKLWLFDFQLPSGRWIENVEIEGNNFKCFCDTFTTEKVDEDTKEYVNELVNAII